MTSAWRRRLSTADQAGLDDWWADVSAEEPVETGMLEDQMRRNRLEAMRHYDPAATMEEELRLRLEGSEQTGALSFELGRELLPPLQSSIEAATSAHVELFLAGLAGGSTVLRIRPAVVMPEHQAEPGLHEDEDLSPVDRGMRKLLELVATAEEEGDVRPWANQLNSLVGLSHVLEKHELTVDFTWLSRNGAFRRSRLSSRGRRFLNQVADFTEHRRTVEVSGQVVELRQAGWVKVKPSSATAAVDVKVEKQLLVGLDLRLWQEVRFLVTEIKQLNQAGKTAARYVFERNIGIDTTYP